MDHQSLAQLNEQQLHMVWQQKFFYLPIGSPLQDFLYKKGCENKVVDALSRVPSSQLSCNNALSSAAPRWLTAVIKSYAVDSHAQSILSKLALDPEVVPHFTLAEGLLR